MRRRTKDPRDRQGYNLGARYLVFLVTVSYTHLTLPTTERV